MRSAPYFWPSFRQNRSYTASSADPTVPDLLSGTETEKCTRAPFSAPGISVPSTESVHTSENPESICCQDKSFWRLLFAAFLQTGLPVRSIQKALLSFLASRHWQIFLLPLFPSPGCFLLFSRICQIFSDKPAAVFPVMLPEPPVEVHWNSASEENTPHPSQPEDVQTDTANFRYASSVFLHVPPQSAVSVPPVQSLRSGRPWSCLPARHMSPSV